MVDEQTHGTRYRMLETLRDYAREKLALSGQTAATAERHCIHFFAVAKQAREGLKGADHGQWTVRVEADQDNLRSATALALAGGADPFIAVKMAVALQGFWILRGQATEGRSVVQAALALPEVQASDMAQAFALYVGAALADAQGDHAEARQKLQTCLALRRRLNVPVDIAATLSTLAQALLKDGDVAGAADCEREALQIFRQAGDEVGIAIGLVHLAECAMALGDDTQARNELAQGLVMAQRMGHGELEAECERLLGEMDFESADLSAAHAHFQRSLAISREAGNKRAEAHALRWQSRVHSQTGQHAAAAQGLGEALRAFRAFEMRDEWLACLEDHAQLLLLAGRGEAATRLAAFAHAEHQRLAGQRLPRAEQRWQLWLAALRDAVPAASFSAAWQTGLAADLESTLREAEAPL